MLYAYLDESYTGDLKTTPEYVVAGFIGTASEWSNFEDLWRQSMKELGIVKIGCHANRCAGGAPPYDGMSVEERKKIQYRLIVDIAAARLFGAVSIIDMEAYRKHRQAFSDSLVPEARQYNEAHVLAVRQCVQHMCLMTEEVTTEPITFIVDRNQQFGKRAKAWYEFSVKNRDDRHSKRFGPYSEESSMEKVGLQAADMLAYAAMREVIGNPGWQWSTILSGVRLGRPFRTSEYFWSEIAERSRQQLEPAVIQIPGGTGFSPAGGSDDAVSS
jgi:hypothetical protein